MNPGRVALCCAACADAAVTSKGRLDCRSSYHHPLPCCQVKDYRLEFSRWWQAEFKTVAFPTEVCMCVEGRGVQL